MAQIKKPLAAALGAAFLASSVAPLVAAEANPFSAQHLNGGYDLPSYDKDTEGGCGGAKGGEGSCGGEKGGEGSCGDKGGEGSCGGDQGGDGSDGDAKGGEGKCGEGKCGGS